MSVEVNPFEPPKATLDGVVAPEDAPALWNPDAAGAWSLLFTPIFGSILVRKNWKAIGDPQKVRTGTIWIAVSVLMLLMSMFIPFIGLLAFVYIIVWYFSWQRPQARFINEHWGREYPRKGWLAPLVTAIAVYVVAVLALFAVGAALSGFYR